MKARDELDEIHVHRQTQIAHLKQRQTAQTRFTARNQLLRNARALCQLLLREARFFAFGAQQNPQHFARITIITTDARRANNRRNGRRLVGRRRRFGRG